MDSEQILTRLELILREVCEVCEECPADLEFDRDAMLPSLGIDSLTLVLVLDRVAAEFQIDWDSGPAAAAVRTLRSIADFVMTEISGRHH